MLLLIERLETEGFLCTIDSLTGSFLYFLSSFCASLFGSVNSLCTSLFCSVDSSTGFLSSGTSHFLHLILSTFYSTCGSTFGSVFSTFYSTFSCSGDSERISGDSLHFFEQASDHTVTTNESCDFLSILIEESLSFSHILLSFVEGVAIEVLQTFEFLGNGSHDFLESGRVVSLKSFLEVSCRILNNHSGGILSTLGLLSLSFVVATYKAQSYCCNSNKKQFFHNLIDLVKQKFSITWQR